MICAGSKNKPLTVSRNIDFPIELVVGMLWCWSLVVTRLSVVGFDDLLTGTVPALVAGV
jgi:hypothetical protein